MAVTETGHLASREVDELYRKHGGEIYRYAYAVLLIDFANLLPPLSENSSSRFLICEHQREDWRRKLRKLGVS